MTTTEPGASANRATVRSTTRGGVRVRAVPGRTRARVAGADQGYHRLWEMAVLFHLRAAFRSGDVWLARSRRYGDIRKGAAVGSRRR